MMPHDYSVEQHARVSIGLCEARVAGMRLRAELDPPRAAVGKFPYDHWTCAEWEELDGHFVAREMTDDERLKDAVEGSAKLLSALLSCAA